MSVYMPLDCDGFATALADYLEGDAPDAVRAAVEAHAEECGSCGPLLADLQGIRRDAASLPVLVPSRDLWSGIAERIDARVLPLGRPARQTIVPVRRTWARPAVAAAALVIATAGITHWVTKQTTRVTPPMVAMTPTPAAVTPESVPAPQRVSTIDTPPSSGGSSGSAYEQTGAQRSGTPVTVATATPRPGAGSATRSSAQLVENAMDHAQPVYDREITKLRTIMKSRRAQLDPKTIAVLEQSIAVIDSAIAQSRAALARDPASGFLAEQLNHSLEKKVELLRTAAMLPART
jgi:hypothetical protein